MLITIITDQMRFWWYLFYHSWEMTLYNLYASGVLSMSYGHIRHLFGLVLGFTDCLRKIIQLRYLRRNEAVDCVGKMVRAPERQVDR